MSVRSLTERAPNGFFFALALRRLNDWVPQARAAAREHLHQLAARSAPEHVVDALWHTLAHWSSWGRMEDVDRTVVVALLSIRDVALGLKSRIMQATAGPATHVLSQAGRAPALDEWLAELATSGIQPSVRAKAYRCLLEGRVVWVIGRKWRWTDVKWCKGRFEPVLGERATIERVRPLDFVRAASADTSPLVRRVAADFLVSQPASIGADAPVLAKQLASDPCAYVAERGRFALGMLGDGA